MENRAVTLKRNQDLRGKLPDDEIIDLGEQLNGEVELTKENCTLETWEELDCSIKIAPNEKLPF